MIVKSPDEPTSLQDITPVTYSQLIALNPRQMETQQFETRRRAFLTLYSMFSPSLPVHQLYFGTSPRLGHLRPLPAFLAETTGDIRRGWFSLRVLDQEARMAAWIPGKNWDKPIVSDLPVTWEGNVNFTVQFEEYLSAVEAIGVLTPA